MSYLVNIAVELDAEQANVADRLSHRLFEVLMDESYVTALSMDVPAPGTLTDVDE